ncbi:hypothetical protein QBC41DRAFT_130113 [Cercophora samala]|uniref:Uncharacterized protein n=1 Tax=Cercophora samala TaxID=330535 RepID=A0AA39ZCN2_9PEZI|nr:hypothetical protein QBC41DRAFT_130113 [Cercophora samala]
MCLRSPLSPEHLFNSLSIVVSSSDKPDSSSASVQKAAMSYLLGGTEMYSNQNIVPGGKAADRCGNHNAGSSERTANSIPRTTLTDLVDPKQVSDLLDSGSPDIVDQTNTTVTLGAGEEYTTTEAIFTSLSKDLDRQCNIANFNKPTPDQVPGHPYTTVDASQTSVCQDHLDQCIDDGNTAAEEIATALPKNDEFWTWDEQRQRFVHTEGNGREIVCPTWFD